MFLRKNCIEISSIGCVHFTGAVIALLDTVEVDYSEVPLLAQSPSIYISMTQTPATRG